MTDSGEFEARLSAVEGRGEQAADAIAAATSDAAAARHLAAARDRDLADLTIKVDANRQAINALGVQTAARFDEVDRRFDEVDRRFEQVDRRFDRLERHVDNGFAEMRARFDQTAAGMAQIVELLTTRDDQ